jgi:hypothetical protein
VLFGVGAQCRQQGGGTCAFRRVTDGFDSICEAWFSVKPVMLKSNIAVRQIAELIQCHWCSVLSQSERRAPGRAQGAASAVDRRTRRVLDRHASFLLSTQRK